MITVLFTTDGILIVHIKIQDNDLGKILICQTQNGSKTIIHGVNKKTDKKKKIKKINNKIAKKNPSH